jgi:hypothetical protein
MTTSSKTLLDAVAQSLVEAHEGVVRLERELDAAKRHYEYIASVDMVEAMRDAGLVTLALPNAGTVDLEDCRVHCSVADRRREEVNVWLKNRGHSKLLTCSVTVDFPRGEYATDAQPFARMAQSWLDAQYAERGLTRQPRVEFSIAPQTLKKLVKESYFLTGTIERLHPGIKWFHAPIARYNPPVAQPSGVGDDSVL